MFMRWCIRDAYGMVQCKNEMMQCCQVLVTWARMHYITKQYWKDSLKRQIANALNERYQDRILWSYSNNSFEEENPCGRDENFHLEL
jgi:hypothetical protein